MAESALDRLYRIEKALDEFTQEDESIMQAFSEFTKEEMEAFDRGLNYMARHPSVASNTVNANPYPDGPLQDAFNSAVEIVRVMDQKTKNTNPGAPLLGKYAMGGPVSSFERSTAPYIWNGIKWIANNLLGFNLKAKGGPIVGYGKHKGFRR
jgi:hypothetical protein